VQKAKRENRVKLNHSALEPLNRAASLNPVQFEQATARLAEHFNTLYESGETIAKLRSTILQLAVQGKLVPQKPNERGIEKEIKETAVINEAEIPFAAPSNWRWFRLGTLAELINGDRGKNYPNKVEYVSNGIPFINTGHIKPDGTLSLTSMHYLTRAKFDTLRSGKIKKGDLVYCLRGATLGKTAIIDQFSEGAVASSLVIVRFDETIDRKYAYYYLTSPTGKKLIRRFDNGSAQPNLSANSVKQYVFPTPPLAEQKRIVTKVNQLIALCDELEANLRQAEDHSGKVMNAAVQYVLQTIASADQVDS